MRSRSCSLLPQAVPAASRRVRQQITAKWDTPADRPLRPERPGDHSEGQARNERSPGVAIVTDQRSERLREAGASQPAEVVCLPRIDLFSRRCRAPTNLGSMFQGCPAHGHRDRRSPGHTTAAGTTRDGRQGRFHKTSGSHEAHSRLTLVAIGQPPSFQSVISSK